MWDNLINNERKTHTHGHLFLIYYDDRYCEKEKKNLEIDRKRKKNSQNVSHEIDLEKKSSINFSDILQKENHCKKKQGEKERRRERCMGKREKTEG